MNVTGQVLAAGQFRFSFHASLTHLRAPVGNAVPRQCFGLGKIGPSAGLTTLPDTDRIPLTGSRFAK